MPPLLKHGLYLALSVSKGCNVLSVGRVTRLALEVVFHFSIHLIKPQEAFTLLTHVSDRRKVMWKQPQHYVQQRLFVKDLVVLVLV